jgi:hypothetical protein
MRGDEAPKANQLGTVVENLNRSSVTRAEHSITMSHSWSEIQIYMREKKLGAVLTNSICD